MTTVSSEWNRRHQELFGRDLKPKDRANYIVEYVTQMENHSPNLLIIDHLNNFISKSFPTIKSTQKKELAMMGMDWAISIRNKKRIDTYKEMEAKIKGVK